MRCGIYDGGSGKMMPDLGKYAFEVLFAYTGTFILLAALIVLSIRDALNSERELKALESDANKK